MTITNQLGRTGHDLRPKTLLEGQVWGSRPLARPYANPLRRAAFTILFGGVVDNVAYSVDITLPDGTIENVTTTRAGGSPATLALVAAAWLTALQEKSWYKTHVKSATLDTATITIRFKHCGHVYAVAATDAGTVEFTVTRTVDPAGVVIPCGRFVRLATLEETASVQLMQNSDTEANIIGVTGRPHTGTRLATALPSEEAGFQPSEEVAPIYEALIGMKNVGAAASANGAVYCVVNDAGGQARGSARGSDDGSNAILISTSRARWLEDTAANEVGLVLVRL